MALQDYIFAYTLIFIGVAVIGIIAVAVMHISTMNKAEQIAKEISRAHAEKIERNIIHDLDTGNFDPARGWVYSSKDSEV